MANKEQESKLVIKEKIYDGETSEIFRLEDGRLYKKVKPIIFSICSRSGINYEAKLHSTNAHSVKEILSPITVTYAGKFCTGFTMEEVHGLNFNEHDDSLTIAQRGDLEMYYDIYSKVESVVRRANCAGIVMPDLASCDNIIMLPDGGIKFIDFDGMQFGKNDKSISFSTSLGNMRNYLMSPKYCTDFCHFTKELDITSLTILMFLDIFNVDLNKVGMRNPLNGQPITVDFIFETLGLEDDVLKRKVRANLSLFERGSYITEDLKRVMKNYDMVVADIPKRYNAPSQYVKHLIRK